MNLNFGQPDKGIMQMAYVVPDIDAAMKSWVDNLGVGLGTCSTASPAIQPNDDHPSVYAEHIAVKGCGFHHFGVATDDYTIDKARYLAMRYELAFEAGVPAGGKVAYLDTNGALGTAPIPFDHSSEAA